MKHTKFARCLSVVAVLALTGVSAFADDYFWTGTSSYYKQNYYYCLDDNENDMWARADGVGDLTRHPTDGNCYWIINGSFKAGNYTSTSTANVTGRNGFGIGDKGYQKPNIGGTVCIGSPVGHPVFGPEKRSGNLYDPYEANVTLTANIDWYNGAIKITGQYNDTFNCAINVKDGGEGAIHQIGSSKASKTNGQAIYLNGSLSSETTNVNISIVCDAACDSTNLDKTKSVHIRTSGDNSNYRGTFSCESAYYPFIIGGTHPLGSPNEPNPAALTLCDNGVFIFYDACTQSPNRGIKLLGSTGWLYQKSGDYTLKYSVSKADGVDGKFVKSGAGKITLACAYSAGDIEVRGGLLRVGSTATFPEGQRFIVRDGAELFINPCPGLKNPKIETEGTGSYSFAEGYRLTDAGEWEVRVSTAAAGDGSVTPAETWVKLGETTLLSATAGASEFLYWTGSTEKIIERSVFASTVTVKADEPITLTANFGTIERPENVTCEDGTTYVFSDRVLRITVPSGVENVYDYASHITDGYVTNVIKQGAGTMKLAAAAGYLGDFEFAAGSVKAGGAGVLGANNVGTIRLLPGAVLTHTANTTCATGKFACLAGTVSTTLTGGEANPFITKSDIVLSGDLVWSVPTTEKKYYLPKNCTFDFAGHKLSMKSPKYTLFYLDGIAFTNSSEAAVTFSVPTYDYTYLTSGTSFFGGPKNVLNFEWDARLYVQTDVTADWTLNVNSLAMLNGVKNSTVNTLDNMWRGTLKVSSTTITSDYSVQFNGMADCVVAFGGPVTGSGLMPIKGGIVNFCCASNSFSGTVSLESSTSSKLRAAIYVWDGAQFSAGKPVTIADGDFHLGTRTHYALGDFVQTDGDCAFTGGPSGNEPCGRATVASFVKTGGDVLTFDSSVVVTGETRIGTGTLALGVGRTEAELPVFSNLVFAAGTTFDMNGNDLAIPNLVGLPKVENPGKLTITGTWTIDWNELKAGGCLDLGNGKLAFAEGAVIVVANRNGETTGDDVVIAKVTGGVEGDPEISGWGRALRLRDNARLALVSVPLRIIVR